MYCLTPPMTEPPEGKLLINILLLDLKDECMLLFIIPLWVKGRCGEGHPRHPQPLWTDVFPCPLIICLESSQTTLSLPHKGSL